MTRRGPHPFAYVCEACDHLASQHFLDEDAPSVDGPYHCRTCSCEISQAGPFYGLRTEHDYEIWLRHREATA